jgi:hypothetical protein
MEQPKSSFFSRATALAKDPSFNPIGGTVGSSIMNGISSFFGRKNKKSAPVTNAPVSSNGNYSSPDVVANGQQFFKQPQ